MGSFYTNVTLRTTDRDSVRQQLTAAGRRAYISPPMAGAVVVFDQACEEQDPTEVDALTSLLSQRCACPALAVVIHDDDIFWYGLYEKGALVDEYTSAPDYFEGGGASPAGGDATRVCAAFARPGVEAELHGILHRAKDVADAYTFETERHAAFVQVLGLPSAAVGTGYNYLEAGELPDDLTLEELVRVG